jgi:histidyl-tRNA synthetase
MRGRSNSGTPPKTAKLAAPHRNRQFFQIGVETIGPESAATDADVIEMVVDILNRAGLSGFELARFTRDIQSLVRTASKR